MTARQVYLYLLVELNKVEAPSLLLDDFIYFLNKAIISYTDKRYALYEMNQQLTDDLGVLSATAPITSLTVNTASIQAATYDGVLPVDYFHILDCVAQFTFLKASGCYKINDTLVKGVRKLQSGVMSALMDNHYLKPDLTRPYYYIHNTDTLATLTDGGRVAGDRKGFISPVKIQIRYGNDTTTAIPTKLFVDYLRVPQYMSISQDEIDATNDTTQIMEFPDYACHEIIKELVALLMENTSNPRLNTNLPINQTIAPPMQTSGAPQKR
jgi:hypothetical protein